jgi:hypothetical protein
MMLLYLRQRWLLSMVSQLGEDTISFPSILLTVVNRHFHQLSRKRVVGEIAILRQSSAYFASSARASAEIRG